MISSSSLCSTSRSTTLAAAFTYALFALAVILVGVWVTDGDFSALLTFAVGLQCVGLLQLAIQVWYRKSVHGISRKSLELLVLVLATRLSVTSVKNGYLPVDSTGDHVYQFADILSLLLIVQLLFATRVTCKKTYMPDADSMNTKWMLPVCAVLATFLHAHLNHSFFWDTLWFFSLYLETFALLPQLWMMTKLGGEVEGMTAHFVACMTGSKAMGWIVWFEGYGELAVEYHDGISTVSTNWPGYAIMLSYTVQVVMCADFVYHYASAVLANRRMTLPMSSV